MVAQKQQAAMAQRTNRRAPCRPATSNLLVHHVDQIAPVDLGGLLRRAAGVGHFVELDDRPAAETDVADCREHGGQVHAAAAQFDPLIAAGLRRRRADILEMQHLDPGTVLPNGGRRIAAALQIVRGVEEQADVPPVGRREDGGDLLRLFAGAVHVMVIDQGHAEILRALAELGQQTADADVVVIGDRAALRPLVDHLEIASPRGAQEFRMGRVRRELLDLASRIDREVAARQHGEPEVPLREQIAQR